MTEAEMLRLLQNAVDARKEGRFDDAIDLLRQGTSQEGPLAVDARLELGELLHLRRRADEAAIVLQEARDAAVKEGASRKAAIAVNLLAINERRRNPELARRLLSQQDLFDFRGAPGPHLAQWFHYRGLLAADQNDLAEGERLLFRAFELYEEINDRGGLSEVCDSLANLLLKHGKARPALEFATRSLDLKVNRGDLYGQAISHGTIGRAHLLQANAAEAEAAFLRDLELVRRLRDPEGTGRVLNSLAETALLRRDPQKAAAWFLESLSAERGLVNALFARLGLARVRLTEDDVGGAEGEADRLAALLEQNPGASARVPPALSGLRGAIAGRRGQVAEAERLIGKAIDDLVGLGLDLETLPWLYELRDLHHRQGSTALAVQAMARALDLLSSAGADESVSDLEQWLRQVDSPALMRLALERHFPDHLLDALMVGRLTQKARAEATVEQVITVLFSDVRDYTTLSEGLEPAEVLDLLNEWFAEVSRIVRRHHGFIDKFIGDAVMALFGVSRRAEESAADGVRAALEMRDSLAALNLRNKALKRKPIRIGVGIHTGKAVVGFVGSHLRLSYTAIGDTVNVASRLESATKGYECDILIGQATEEGQRREGVAETAPRGLAHLKGKGIDVPVHEVLGWKEGGRKR